MLNIIRYTFSVLTCLMLTSYAQANLSGFNIHSILVTGNYTLNEDRIVYISGLEEKWLINKEDLQQATKNLWSVGIFSDIQMHTINYGYNAVDLSICLEEYPRLNKIYISGTGEFGVDQIKGKINIEERMFVSTYKLWQIRQKLTELYISEGYLGAHINTYTIPSDSGGVNLIIHIDEGKEIEIEQIVFHGNRAFEARCLKDIMQATNEDRWFRSAHFLEQDYKNDLELILNFYRSKGFRDVEIIRDSISFCRDRTPLTIDIWLEEGLPYYITQIDFEGNSLFTHQQLLDRLVITYDDRYSIIKINASIANLMNCYHKIGNCYTTIITKEIPLSKDCIKLIFVIDEKNSVKVRNVRITGNKLSKDKIIRRQLLVLPGQKFNRDLLTRTVRDLWVTDYFSSICTRIEPVDEDNVDVVFNVKEKITSKSDFSGGWSEQTGITGGIDLNTNNFLGNGQTVGLQANVGQNSKSLLFNFSEPWLWSKPVSAGLSLYYNNQNPRYTGYSQESIGGIFRIGHKLRWPDENFHMDWIYKWDQTTLSDFSDRIAELNPRHIMHQSYPLISSSITHVIRRNTLDNDNFPKSGSMLSLSNEFSGGFLGGNAQYHKHRLDIMCYKSFSENLILGINFTGATMNGYGKNSTIPYLKRFFLGGGYMSSSIPLRGYIDPLTSESENKKGGTLLFKSGLELRYRILMEPLIYALTFAEAGETWDKIHSAGLSNLRHSLGFGVRIELPILGMIGIDFAYAFDPLNLPTDRQIGHWQIYFIIGKLFRGFSE